MFTFQIRFDIVDWSMGSCSFKG